MKEIVLLIGSTRQVLRDHAARSDKAAKAVSDQSLKQLFLLVAIREERHAISEELYIDVLERLRPRSPEGDRLLRY